MQTKHVCKQSILLSDFEICGQVIDRGGHVIPKDHLLKLDRDFPVKLPVMWYAVFLNTSLVSRHEEVEGLLNKRCMARSWLRGNCKELHINKLFENH